MMVRRADGALLCASVTPYPSMLYASVRGQRWEEAVRLCRYYCIVDRCRTSITVLLIVLVDIIIAVTPEEV